MKAVNLIPVMKPHYLLCIASFSAFLCCLGQVLSIFNIACFPFQAFDLLLPAKATSTTPATTSTQNLPTSLCNSSYLRHNLHQRYLAQATWKWKKKAVGVWTKLGTLMSRIWKKGSKLWRRRMTESKMPLISRMRKWRL